MHFLKPTFTRYLFYIAFSSVGLTDCGKTKDKPLTSHSNRNGKRIHDEKKIKSNVFFY